MDCTCVAMIVDTCSLGRDRAFMPPRMQMWLRWQSCQIRQKCPAMQMVNQSLWRQNRCLTCLCPLLPVRKLCGAPFYVPGSLIIDASGLDPAIFAGRSHTLYNVVKSKHESQAAMQKIQVTSRKLVRWNLLWSIVCANRENIYAFFWRSLWRCFQAASTLQGHPRGEMRSSSDSKRRSCHMHSLWEIKVCETRAIIKWRLLWWCCDSAWGASVIQITVVNWE